MKQADKKRERERKLLLLTLTLTMAGTLAGVVALSSFFTRETFSRVRSVDNPHNLAELIPVVAALMATAVVMITAIPMLTRQEKRRVVIMFLLRQTEKSKQEPAPLLLMELHTHRSKFNN